VQVSILVVLSNIYILVHYSHPDDKNQAWVRTEDIEYTPPKE
jgi:hypothetical protein